MGTPISFFIGRPWKADWVTYLPSQDKECEEEDEEGDSSHQFWLLQHSRPEEAMGQGCLLSCPFTMASPCPQCPWSPQPPSRFALWVVQVSEVRTVLPCPTTQSQRVWALLSSSHAHLESKEP